MAERKVLSKKTRFEVFKRDKFTCQYCGRVAPDVILEVDHIKPVAKGGTDDFLNLITSCRDCNRGKGATTLSENAEIKKVQQYLLDLADKKEQVMMLLDWKTELLRAAREEAKAINDLIEAMTGKSMADEDYLLIRKQLIQFSFEEVYDATILAFDRYFDYENPNNVSKSFYKALYKIGGICYNKRKQKEGEQNGSL